MSRRHSSKSHKNRNQNKLEVQENSIGAAIFAKNPDLADALAEKAKSTATNGLTTVDVNTVFNALVSPRLMMPPMLNR